MLTTLFFHCLFEPSIISSHLISFHAPYQPHRPSVDHRESEHDSVPRLEIATTTTIIPSAIIAPVIPPSIVPPTIIPAPIATIHSLTQHHPTQQPPTQTQRRTTRRPARKPTGLARRSLPIATTTEASATVALLGRVAASAVALLRIAVLLGVSAVASLLLLGVAAVASILLMGVAAARLAVFAGKFAEEAAEAFLFFFAGRELRAVVGGLLALGVGGGLGVLGLGLVVAVACAWVGGGGVSLFSRRWGKGGWREMGDG